MRVLTGAETIRIRKPRPVLTGATRIRLSEIDWAPYASMVLDERHKYRPGDRAAWKDGIYEKQPNGTWHKVAERSATEYATPHAKGERNRYVRALAAAKSTQRGGGRRR